MPRLPLRYGPSQPSPRAITLGDVLLSCAFAALLYAGVRLAVHAPAEVAAEEMSLSPRALPWYALLSTTRMGIAYALSLTFSLVYGRAAARSRAAERVLLPIVDVLQSVPILSFQALVVLGLTVVFSERLACEIAAIVLIFTSQAWNLTYCFYQSQTQVPTELREAAAVFRLGSWLRFATVDLPFGALGLIWNSVMSWAGGWFFLMAAEMLLVGDHSYRLPGLGSWLQVAADRGDANALVAGALTLAFVVVVIDQLVWRPLLAWATKFKLETVSGEEAATPWFLGLLRRSWLARAFATGLWAPLCERLAQRTQLRTKTVGACFDAARGERMSPGLLALLVALALATLYGGYHAALLVAPLPAATWREIGLSLLATLARVGASLAIALVWTVPAGVAIGTSQRLRRFVQPLVQVAASFPATALFPMLLLLLIRLPGGLDLSAILLMLLGTQWYLLFNVIAGTAAIPQDLRDTSRLLRLSRWRRWRTLVLPALFPYLVTGAITACGGAWNASIIAERVEYAGETHTTLGIGALIARANAARDYPLLVAATLGLVATVVALNRIVWSPLYRVAETRYRLE